jgi:hypothetical protein
MSSSPIFSALAVARVRAVRMALVDLHKAIVDFERRRFEQSRGRIEGAHAALQLLLKDPFFAWFRPLAQVIAELDGWLAADGPRRLDEAAQLVEGVRALLVGDAGGDAFRSEYRRALQDSPDTVVAHGRVTATLAKRARE